jgi:protease-4
VRHAFVLVRWLVKRLLIPALAVVGGVVVLGLIIFAVAIAGGGTATAPVPDRVVLEVNLERRLIEYVPQDPIAQALLLTEKPLTLRDLTDGIQRAAGDRRVVGLIARVGAAQMGLATIQEVRDAIGLFAASGKFTIAFSESFGEFGPGTGAYYLASAFDEIYLQPSGDLGLTGLAYESPFLRGSFDKLKIEPRLLQRKEYKNFADMFLRRDYSDAHREAMHGLMKSQFDQIVSGIGTSRDMAATEVASIMDLAPFSASQALHHGFVDSLLYRDEVYGLVDDRSGSADRLYLRKYLARAGRPNQVGPTIALIYGIGPVHRGRTEFDPLDDSSTMGSSTVAAAFRDAVGDGSVKAILFRVSSPGGSYVASDIIWREVVKARAAGKPVVVSMGDVAASGGYLVSVAANRIVAQPGTITGSIGVVAGKWLTRQFWKEHAGVTWDAVQTSENSNLWSSLDDYTPEQLTKLNGILDRIYSEFTDKVAEGRNLDLSAVLPVAKGRVWTGEAAAARGLADTLGGLDLALRIARVEAGLNKDAPVTLTVFPREKEPLETIMEELFDQGPDNSDAMVQVVAARQILETLRPLYRAAVDAGLIDRGQVVRMPSAKVVW